MVSLQTCIVMLNFYLRIKPLIVCDYLKHYQTLWYLWYLWYYQNDTYCLWFLN